MPQDNNIEEEYRKLYDAGNAYDIEPHKIGKHENNELENVIKNNSIEDRDSLPLKIQALIEHTEEKINNHVDLSKNTLAIAIRHKVSPKSLDCLIKFGADSSLLDVEHLKKYTEIVEKENLELRSTPQREVAKPTIYEGDKKNKPPL